MVIEIIIVKEKVKWLICKWKIGCIDVCFRFMMVSEKEVFLFFKVFIVCLNIGFFLLIMCWIISLYCRYEIYVING